MNNVKFKTWLLLGIIITCSPLYAGSDDKNFGNLAVSEVTSIYDGDTFRANIANVHPLMGKRIAVRISGVDTPEIKGKCKKEKYLAREAKKITVAMLRSASSIELRNVKRGKYFRIVADVYVDGRSLTEALISSGLAVSYTGGRKTKDWCK